MLYISHICGSSAVFLRSDLVYRFFSCQCFHRIGHLRRRAAHGDRVRDFEFRHGRMDDVFLALTRVRTATGDATETDAEADADVKAEGGG